MLVRDCMRAQVLTLAPHDTLRAALDIMRREHVRHLPVVEGERLVGIVTDRDVRQVTHSSIVVREATLDALLLDTVRVAGFMTTRPVTIAPDAPLLVAAKLLKERRIGALPVVEGDRLIGILSETDLLDVLIDLLERHAR